MIWIASISLLVGGVAIANTMFASIMERTQEIGIRKAIGARRRYIRRQFLTEAMTLSLAGGAAGVLVGLGIAQLVCYLSPFPAKFSPEAILVGLVVAVLVGLFFGTYPAWKAARLNLFELTEIMLPMLSF